MGMTTIQPDDSKRSMSFRARLILATILITFLAVAAMGLYTFYRTQQTDRYLTSQLDTSVRQQAEIDLQKTGATEVEKLNNFFVTLRKDITSLGATSGKMLSNEASFNTGAYWDAEKALYRLANGNWDNPNSDQASVFVPGNVEPGPALISELNTLSTIDFNVLSILEANPDTVAIYFGGRQGETIYYPNIDLSALVGPDFTAVARPWYIDASPQNNPDKKPVWSAPYLDAAANGLVVTIAVPVHDTGGQFRGVQAMDIQLNRITEIVSNIKIGETGHAFLLDKEKRLIAMPPAAYTDFGITPDAYPLGTILLSANTSTELDTVVQKMARGDSGLDTITINNVEHFIMYTPVAEVGYSLAIVVPSQELLAGATEARAQIAQSTRNSLLLAALLVTGILGLAFLGAFIFGNRLVKPLAALTAVAQEISAGNFNARAQVQGQDEIGLLASAFNSMTDQIRGSFSQLEQRVAERTQSLELASEVGRAVSQVRSLDEMLTDAAELIRSRFDLYYVQVYLVDDTQNKLVLRSGTGSAGAELLGRAHSLPIQITSINGRAAFEKQPVVVADTAASGTFKPNPLLPETRSEMAIPLMVGNKVVGVLDLQSSQPNALNPENLTVFEALAGQLAIAIQNATYLEETQQARAEVERQAQRLARGSWAEYLDAVNQPETLAYVYQDNDVTTQNEDIDLDAVEQSNVLVAPITVTGEALGSLVVELEDKAPIANPNVLVENVARQVAQQIENLRLLEMAERSRAEAEKAARRITVEGWKEFMNLGGRESLGYQYDLKQVLPVSDAVVPGDIENSINLPIKVREEPIGNLVVQDVASEDQKSLDLIQAVAERLSAHIESLRQQTQTQSALQQTENLSAASLRLAQAGDLNDMLQVIHETLNIPAINRIVLGVFSYTAENELDEMTVAANWWNNTGSEPTPIGQRYNRQTLNAIDIFRSPTPLFSNNTSQDERIQGTALMVVQQQNIRSMGAVPLFIGSRQTGILMLECEEHHTFTQAEIQLFSAMAPQVAIVLENRMQYERAQKQAERQSALNIISQKIQSATSVEAVLQIAARELGHALGAPRTIAQLSLKDKE